MKRRPRGKIEMTLADKLVELIGWLLLMLIWVLVITSYYGLPETIPTHYNTTGEIDGFGERLIS